MNAVIDSDLRIEGIEMSFAKLKKRWARERASRISRSQIFKQTLIDKGKPVFEKFGITKVFVFGSVVDNRCNEKSDIDILVLSLPNEKFWIFQHELEEAIGISVDLYTDRDDPTFIKKIILRGECIYEV